MDVAGDMAKRLQELLDKQEILEVLARYARGCDRVNPELMASVYHDGAWDFHGSFRGLGRDMSFDIKRESPDNIVAHHALCQSMIELDGDVARVETYYIASGIRNYPSGRRVRRIHGRYIDRFERRDGEWKIAVRRALVDLSQEEPEGDLWPPDPDFDKGTRWPSDAVFNFDAATNLTSTDWRTTQEASHVTA
jgi:hypothetical protein